MRQEIWVVGGAAREIQLTVNYERAAKLGDVDLEELNAHLGDARNELFDRRSCQPFTQG